jgi:hypothetical protein
MRDCQARIEGGKAVLSRLQTWIVGRTGVAMPAAAGNLCAQDIWLAAMAALKDPFKGQEKVMAEPAWKRITAAADRYSEPGRFTPIWYTPG